MARASSALVVDSDIKGLEALVYGFQGADWRITACPAPESAAFLVKASGAELVVVAARDGHEKILAMLRQLRATAESQSLPVLALGPAVLRAALGEFAPIDLLPLPVFVRDVITASRLLVEGAAGQKAGGEAQVQGCLADYGLLSLVRTMTGLRRSGVLHIERGGRRGEITFAEGAVAAAQLGALQGQAAVHHMMMWDEDARITLQLRPVARRGGANQRPEQLLDEAERFLRDYTHAIKDVGPASSVYRRDEAKLSKASREVPPEVTPVVRLFDGQRSLGTVIDESPFRVFDTLRIINRLVYLGILVRREPRAATPENGPLHQFWSTARILGVNSEAAASLAPAGKPENRIGAPSRRKGQRRVSNQTLDLGAPLLDAAAEPRKAEATPAPAAPIERRDADRRGDGHLTPGHDRPVTSPASGVRLHPSFAPHADEMSSLPVTPPPQSVAAPAAVVPQPAPAPPHSVAAPAAVVPQPAPITAPAAARPADSPVKGIGAVKVAGTLSVPSAHRAGGRSKSPGGISVEFDPALRAEMDAMESTPPPVAVAAPRAAEPGKKTADAGSDSRAGGVIAVPAPHRTPAKAQAGGMSVDPALLAEMEVLEKAEQALPALRAPAAAAPTPSPVRNDKRDKDDRPASQPNKSKASGDFPKRRPTGGFSDVEADFFAREAELYKQDDSSFADLDEPAGKGPRKPPSKR